MDLMDMVKGAVSKQIMGQIGGILGTDEKKTKSVFETASGSILGGLIKKAGNPQGARDVFDMAQKQDTGILDKLGDILGGDGPDESFTKSGGGILDGVFGSNQTSMLGTLAKFLGLKDNMMGSLMKILAPIVMAVIGKHIKNKALDAVGLGSFLGEQKKSLGFMPSQLTEGLGFGNLLGNVSDQGKAAVGAAVGAAHKAGDAGRAAANDAAKAGGGLVKLLLPLLILAALAFVAWKFLLPMINGGVDKAKDTVAQVGDGIKDAAGSMTIPGLDLDGIEGFDMGSLGDAGPQLVKGMGGITSGFEGLKDAAGAGELATKIKDFTGSIDGMGLANLPDAGKASAKGLIGKFIETITGLLGGQGDGIKGILEPVVNALKAKLTGVLG